MIMALRSAWDMCVLWTTAAARAKKSYCGSCVDEGDGKNPSARRLVITLSRQKTCPARLDTRVQKRARALGQN